MVVASTTLNSLYHNNYYNITKDDYYINKDDIDEYYDPNSRFISYDGSGAQLWPGAVHIAGILALTATVLSMVSILSHLKNYRKPHLQRFVVRIIGMVPIYALTSWASLVSLDAAFYLDAVRDIYEAFVIYCFFNLLINYLGGERSILILLHGRPPTRHVMPVSIFIKDMDVGDPYSFLFLKRGILQYVYIKPILAAVTLILKWFEKYHDGLIAVQSGYFWVSLIFNVSCTLTLYCLAMFYMCTKEDLRPYRPVPKFLCVKAVIFFSFWQGFAISVLAWLNVIPGDEYISVAIQDFLICVEMVAAAIAHWYAFSYQDYYNPYVLSARMPMKYAFKDAIGMKDVIEDTLETLRGSRFNYRTFEPAEGMAHIGASRTSRIMAGLRYASGGASKYWVTEPNQRTALLSGGNTISNVNNAENQDYNLDFPDQLDVEVEAMYDHSRKLGRYGDYNFPVIDGNYGILRNTGKPVSSSSTIGKRKETLSKKKHNGLKVREKPRQLSDVVPPFRPGCVDLVKEVKDESGRHLESYVEAIEQITTSSSSHGQSSASALPILDPFVLGVRLPPNVPLQPQNHYKQPDYTTPITRNHRQNEKPLSNSVNSIKGSNHFKSNNNPSQQSPFKILNKNSSNITKSKPISINGSSREAEKRRVENSDNEEENDPLGASRNVNYLSQSMRSLEKNIWKENIWDS
ncbi:5482_t:CDS:2 [Ambispora leptoticha]|uniref:5482_t:CDS:1 n=1 Tax=Ambispora leptoticha TaxID=144679 RepID=A0A9N8ZPE6_9GLOM|nr:5482_t:CDS:2 [Ambispora leptoticha]